MTKTASIPLLLETICLKDGQLLHLDQHQRRLDRAQTYYQQSGPGIDLAAALAIPEDKRQGRYKLRLEYDTVIRSVEITPYRIRPVSSLQLVTIDRTFRYDHKFADRKRLQAYFHGRTFGDDILMVRNGLLTDTSYANVALYDGKNWCTPAKPLLPGTARARLLEEGLLKTADIHWEELVKYQQIRLINAMMDWGEAPQVAMVDVSWQ